MIKYVNERTLRIGFVGSIEGFSEENIEKIKHFINHHYISEVHHGDCTGADKIFHDLMIKRKCKIIIHPPKENIFRAYYDGDVIIKEKSYSQLCKDIVDECDMLLSCSSKNGEHRMRSKTWNTLRYAKSQRKKIKIFF